MPAPPLGDFTAVVDEDAALAILDPMMGREAAAAALACCCCSCARFTPSIISETKADEPSITMDDAMDGRTDTRTYGSRVAGVCQLSTCK